MSVRCADGLDALEVMKMVFSFESFMYAFMAVILFEITYWLIQLAVGRQDESRKNEIYDPYYSGGTFNPYDGPHGPCFKEIDSYNPYAESKEGEFGVEDKYKRN